MATRRTTERSRYPRAGGCSLSRTGFITDHGRPIPYVVPGFSPAKAGHYVGYETASRRRQDGFTLVEVLICTLILTTGMLSIAALLGFTTQMHLGARQAARGTRLAEEKIDELMKLNFNTAPSVAVGGSLVNDVANYFEEPVEGITVRWEVDD